jgi:hypothetical protein
MPVFNSKSNKSLFLNYNSYLIIFIFLAWIYFIFLPFHADLVLFGTSMIAQKANEFDYLNNTIHGRLLLQKYIYYFLHIISAHFLENKNLYQIVFRGYYSLFLIISAFIYSKFFCDYNNRFKNKKYDLFFIFFIFCFIFLMSPQRISLSSEEMCAAISLVAFAIFLSRKNFLIFLSGLLIGLTFFFKVATIFVGLASVCLIIYEFYKNKALQTKKKIFLFCLGILFSLFILLFYLILFPGDALTIFVMAQTTVLKDVSLYERFIKFFQVLSVLIRHYPIIVIINFFYVLQVFLKIKQNKLIKSLLLISPILIMAFGVFIQATSSPYLFGGFYLTTIIFLSKNYFFLRKNIKLFVLFIFALFFDQTIRIYYDPLKILGNYPSANEIKLQRKNTEKQYLLFVDYFKKNYGHIKKEPTCLYLDYAATYYLNCKSENYYSHYLYSRTVNIEYKEKFIEILKKNTADIIIINIDWYDFNVDLDFLHKQIASEYEVYPLTIINENQRINLFIKKKLLIL